MDKVTPPIPVTPVTYFLKLEIEKIVSLLSNPNSATNPDYHENLFLAYLCKVDNKKRSVELLAKDYPKILFPKTIKYLQADEGEKLFCDLIIKNCPSHQHASVADFFPKGSYTYLKLVDLAT